MQQLCLQYQAAYRTHIFGGYPAYPETLLMPLYASRPPGVLFTNECLISSVLPDRSRNLWRCDALFLEFARCSPSRSGVTATSPCTILYMRARRWDFRRCSNICHLRSLASWEMLTCSRGLFPHTQRTALFCIFCNASWSFFQCGSHIVAAYSALDLTRLK